LLDSLNKMGPRGSRLEPIAEILCFMSHQSVAKFHDAHRVRGYSVVGKYKLSNPEIAAADNSPDCKTLLVWLHETALLNIPPTVDPLPRLRIIKHGILAVDVMFDLKVVCIRSVPMALQGYSQSVIIHLILPSTLPAASFWGPRESVKAGDLHSKHTTPLQLRIHLANPELQKLIDGNRASAGRNKIKQHQCVHHFRLVKPIVDTICPINRLVARNYRWRVRKEGYRTNDQEAKGCQRREKSDRDAEAAKKFNSRNKPLQYANVWDVKDPKRL